MPTSSQPFRFRKAAIGVAALVAVLVGSCSGGSESDSDAINANGNSTSSTLGVGSGSDNNGAPEMTISEAAAAADGTEVSVEGFVVADSGVVVLAELLAESFPPQAGGKTIVVEDFDLSAVALESSGPESWSNQPLTLTGTVVAGALTEAEVLSG
jgi:hypothetical protein